MLSFRNILALFAIALVTQSAVAIASDDNPWIMDETGEGQQSYYDLNGSSRAAGFNDRSQRGSGQREPRVFSGGNRANESTVAKSLPSGERMGWQSGPGKTDRNEVYGYAGPQTQTNNKARGSIDRSRFGPFPPISGGSEVKRQVGTSAGVNGGVRFRGKIFGAFPPLQQQKRGTQNQQRQNIQRIVPGVQSQRTSAFANVLPSPVPEPAPAAKILPYPYVGYGAVPGYGMQYGTGLAPYAGMNQGRSGPTFMNPGMSPGVLGPGLMW